MVPMTEELERIEAKLDHLIAAFRQLAEIIPGAWGRAMRAALKDPEGGP